jgi:hypothetical protein
MRPALHPKLRYVLRKTGPATVAVLAGTVSASPRTVRLALANMPDAYVSGWGAFDRGRAPAIWSVVIPPANAPYPGEQPSGETK